MVDKVVKYESFIDDLTHVFDKLSIPFEGSLGVRARSEHSKDRRLYTEVYKHEQRTIIEKAFNKEIQMHDYTY